jgi:hypothetical protein
VIVDHANGLHVGVDDGRSDELEPALLEIVAELASIFNRLRMISGSATSLSIFALVYRATFSGSNLLKARR